MSKKPAAVVAAEAERDRIAAELSQAKAAVALLEFKFSAACGAVRAAQVEADATLPQCRMVRVRWRSDAEEDEGRMVILRRTPTGMIVARRVGEADGSEYRFKLGGAYRTVFVEHPRPDWMSNRFELRDVPAEFMPAEAAQERA